MSTNRCAALIEFVHNYCVLAPYHQLYFFKDPEIKWVDGKIDDKIEYIDYFIEFDKENGSLHMCIVRDFGKYMQMKNEIMMSKEDRPAELYRYKLIGSGINKGTKEDFWHLFINMLTEEWNKDLAEAE